jgi:hypothetical protein
MPGVAAFSARCAQKRLLDCAGFSQCCPTTVEDRPSSACVTEDEFYFQQYGQIIYAVAGTKAK